MKSAHGTMSMAITTSSAKQLRYYAEKLYRQIVDPYHHIRRVSLTYNHVIDEAFSQYDLFTDPEEMEREHQLQKAMLNIKEKFGKNAILKGMNLEKAGTTMERNQQIGGHKSGEI